ncbi:MAG TPA: hypothetical protein VG897_17440 [Terriglobales bacterium]|nr:hypothetical protein [Terriglobales bacterium]
MKLTLTLLLFSTMAFAESARPAQRFVCNTGYTIEQCHEQMARVRNLVARYHGDWLGDWTWVLVRADDWKPLLRQIGGNPESPAFSVLGKRSTFFDEALFQPTTHGAELLQIWQMPMDRLAVLAVTHEIGHALCNDPNEARADQRAQILQKGGSPDCGPRQLQAQR